MRTNVHIERGFSQCLTMALALVLTMGLSASMGETNQPKPSAGSPSKPGSFLDSLESGARSLQEGGQTIQQKLEPVTGELRNDSEKSVIRQSDKPGAMSDVINAAKEQQKENNKRKRDPGLTQIQQLYNNAPTNSEQRRQLNDMYSKLQDGTPKEKEAVRAQLQNILTSAGATPPATGSKPPDKPLTREQIEEALYHVLIRGSRSGAHESEAVERALEEAGPEPPEPPPPPPSPPTPRYTREQLERDRGNMQRIEGEIQDSINKIQDRIRETGDREGYRQELEQKQRDLQRTQELIAEDEALLREQGVTPAPATGGDTPSPRIDTTRYNPNDDIPDDFDPMAVDTGTAGALQQAGSDSLQPKPHAGDEGGSTVDQTALGGDLAGAEASARTTHTLMPGDHQGRRDSGMDTGTVRDPFAEAAATAGQIADTARSTREAVSNITGLGKSDDWTEHGEDEGHHPEPGVDTASGTTTQEPSGTTATGTTTTSSGGSIPSNEPPRTTPTPPCGGSMGGHHM
jgi:hypothetical protein